MRISRGQGFTLVELLVTMAVLSTLALIVYASLNSIRVKARDVQRVNDMEQILLAARLYAERYDTFLVAGTGHTDRGLGFFSYSGGAYTQSIMAGLQADGLIANDIHDPLVPINRGSSNGHRAYMYYPAEGGFTAGACAFAELEDPTVDELATINSQKIPSGTRTYVQSIGINYARCI